MQAQVVDRMLCFVCYIGDVLSGNLVRKGLLQLVSNTTAGTCWCLQKVLIC